MKLLAYIGRFFHGLAPQPNVETVSSYARIKRFYSRTDKGVNAVSNPVEVEADIHTDFVISRGFARGRPKHKEYLYFVPQELIKPFEEFVTYIPRRISAKALVSSPRKERQSMEIETGPDYISFSSSGFEQYAIRRTMGYFLEWLKGRMSSKEVEESLRGNVKRYPGLAPPEPLVLRRVDVEEDDGMRRSIERLVSSWARFFSHLRLKYIRHSKRLIKKLADEDFRSTDFHITRCPI